jgi:hypothetical protein
MKRILAALTLSCFLSISALAGEIPTCSPVPPAATTTGEISTDGSESVTGNTSSDVSSETESSALTGILLTLVTLIVR